MAWIAVHQSFFRHKKLIVAAAALGVDRFKLAGHVICLWEWALDNAPEGDLTGVPPGAIAVGAEWKDDAVAFVRALCDVRLIDRSDDGGRMALHDWDEHAGRLIERREKDAERLRRWRAARRNGTAPAGAAVPAAPSIKEDETRFDRVSKRRGSDGARPDAPHKAPVQAPLLDAAAPATPGTAPEVKRVSKRANSTVYRDSPSPSLRSGEGAGRPPADGGGPTPTRGPKPPPAPAVLIAREVLHFQPDQTQREAIAAAVPDEAAALATWQRCCVEWRLRGHNVRNLAGILDWFHDGGPPPRDRPAPRSQAPPRSGPAARTTGAALAARRLAQMGGGRNGLAADVPGVPEGDGPAHLELPAPRRH
jgi:hypothetical protein